MPPGKDRKVRIRWLFYSITAQKWYNVSNTGGSQDDSMATISVSLPSDGTAADVSDYNTPITTIVNEVNGNLDNANIKSGAAIATSKLADDAGITTAKIAAGAVTSEKLTLTVAARAYANTSQSIASGAARKVTLDTENYDLGSDFDSTTNYRFTAPITGYYQVNAAVQYSNLTGTEQIIIYIYKNGSPYSGSKDYVPTTNDDPSTVVSDLVPLNAGEYLELYTQSTSTKSLVAGSASNYMSVHLVGAA